ncbi:MAG: protein-glutamate O-methyltransferase CheR [Phycisphaerae bacterium]|nr:protein-glutamate O-methyltransferase CheR [Phycisphaerae bacterium]
MPTVAAMSTAEFHRLRQIIYDRSGIHFPDAKKYVLESRLSQRLGELEIENYSQYADLLSIGPYQAEEFQEMFNRITINETSFFRNVPQLEYFERETLPAILEKRRGVKRLRIWSAACSSGEEPFTLAILVHRTLGIRLADWKIEILGTDISEKALNVATEGAYTSYSIRGTPETVLHRYFRKQGETYTIDPVVRSMVAFEVMNLKDKMAARRHGVWDIIFCRNVLIYFDDAGKTQVLRTLAEQMAPDGRLFLGHSESVRGLNVPIVQLQAAQAFAYEHAPKGVKG